jgi:hypothetical protein
MFAWLGANIRSNELANAMPPSKAQAACLRPKMGGFITP